VLLEGESSGGGGGVESGLGGELFACLDEG
jgi:hypothetical protein